MRKPHFSLLGVTGALKALPRLRRHRPRTRSIIAAAAVGIAALGASGLAHPTPRLVWNATASAPLGLYWVTRDRAIARGDLVLAHLPEPAERLAATRGYLPSSVPAVKRVAALADDVVCADSGIVVINNQVVATTLLIDGQGRPLPAWNGCRVLAEGEVFLLMAGVPASFDGRYFGPIGTAAIIGRLVPLWTW